MTPGGAIEPRTPRIVDAVLEATRPPPRRQRLAFALVTAFLVHAGALAAALWSSDSLEGWASELAVRIHEELGRETVIETARPPPPPPVEKPPPPPPRERRPSAPRAARPPPPAQSGQVIARAADPSQPRDLTGDTFVTGTASSYVGGVTSSRGTNTQAVESRVVDPKSPPGPTTDLSRLLQIADEDYFRHCPWPPEAESADVDQVSVSTRIQVRSDGTTEHADVVHDPGMGFGRAAVACLLSAPRSVWEVALDASGRPVTASRPFNLEFRR